MKTTILLTIEHSKPLPDITDVICSRVWPYGGGCITDMTAAIQEEPKDLGRMTDWLESTYQDRPWIHVQAVQTESACTPVDKRGFWSWLWRTQS